jgi:hypothetical protein
MALTSVNAFNVIIYFCARTELIGMDMNLHYPHEFMILAVKQKIMYGGIVHNQQ